MMQPLVDRAAQTRYVVQARLQGGVWIDEAVFYGENKVDDAVAYAKKMKRFPGPVRLLKLAPSEVDL